MAGATVRNTLDPAKIDKLIKKILVMRLRVCCALLRAHIVRNISTPTRSVGPSDPGEYPHADTGRLRQSIFYDADESVLVASVYTNVKYGVFLELGTSKMAPRPFLSRALAEKAAEIKAILGAPMSSIDTGGGGGIPGSSPESE